MAEGAETHHWVTSRKVWEDARAFRNMGAVELGERQGNHSGSELRKQVNEQSHLKTWRYIGRRPLAPKWNVSIFVCFMLVDTCSGLLYPIPIISILFRAFPLTFQSRLRTFAWRNETAAYSIRICTECIFREISTLHEVRWKRGCASENSSALISREMTFSAHNSTARSV